MDEFLARVKSLLSRYGFAGRLGAAYPGCEKSGVEPMVTAALVPAQHTLVGVWLDVTLPAKEGDPKTSHHPDGQLIRFLSSCFGVDLREGSHCHEDDLLAVMQRRFDAALKRMKPVRLAEIDDTLPPIGD